MPRNRLSRAVAARIAPNIHAAAKIDAGHKIQRLLGFWVAFHFWGGQDKMIESGHWSRAGVYKQRQEFRDVFGWDVADVWPEATQGLSQIQGYRGPAPR